MLRNLYLISFQLLQVTSQVADPVQTGESQEVTGITEEIVEKLQEKATVLTQERKKRGKTVPEGLCSSESMKQFSVKSSHPGLHSASVPGKLVTAEPSSSLF